MKVYRIAWTETERGWGTRPDGYSFHKTPEDAAAYLRETARQMPLQAPDDYSYPGAGWTQAVHAVEVEIKDDGLIAREIKKQNSARVYAITSECYSEALSAVPTGRTCKVEYRQAAQQAKPKPSRLKF